MLLPPLTPPDRQRLQCAYPVQLSVPHPRWLDMLVCTSGCMILGYTGPRAHEPSDAVCEARADVHVATWRPTSRVQSGSSLCTTSQGLGPHKCATASSVSCSRSSSGSSGASGASRASAPVDASVRKMTMRCLQHAQDGQEVACTAAGTLAALQCGRCAELAARRAGPGISRASSMLHDGQANAHVI